MGSLRPAAAEANRRTGSVVTGTVPVRADDCSRGLSRRGPVVTVAATQTRWLSLQAAADLLGLTAAALRKSLDRRAVRTSDGGIEAELDGVRGRKLGRLWRVTLSAAWTAPTPPKVAVSSALSQSVRDDREGTRS